MKCQGGKSYDSFDWRQDAYRENTRALVLEKYSYPYLSIDHLKMGLIRGGICPFSPESPDEELTPFLWGIIKEIVKTAIENGQKFSGGRLLYSL